MNQEALILIAISGLCPLSFLIGIGCMFIIALQLGWGQYAETQTIEDLPPRQFSQVIEPCYPRAGKSPASSNSRARWVNCLSPSSAEEDACYNRAFSKEKKLLTRDKKCAIVISKAVAGHID